MKKLIISFCFLILLMVVSIIHNRCVFIIVEQNMNSMGYYQALHSLKRIIPFDPFLYWGKYSYEKVLLEIEAGRTIREYCMYHPIDKSGMVDIVTIKSDLFLDLKDINIDIFWTRYNKVISFTHKGNYTEATREYTSLIQECGTEPSTDASLWIDMEKFHKHYLERIREIAMILHDMDVSLTLYDQDKDSSHLKKALLLLAPVEYVLELRYNKNMPLYYINNSIISNIVIFQGVLINSLINKSYNEAALYYSTNLKPVIKIICNEILKE